MWHDLGMTKMSEIVGETGGAPVSVRVEKPGEVVDGAKGVARVTLIGPGKNNSMGPEFWAELPGVVRELDEDPEVRAILFAGEGRNFSYGLDLVAMMPVLGRFFEGGEIDGSRTLDLHELVGSMREAIDAVGECKTPTVAAVQGRCIGGAVDLISACDVRHASADATFSIREVKVGIVADMGSLSRLPHIIGDGLTRELALTGRDLDAESALRYGLVSNVADSAEGVLASADAVAGEIAANPPLVVRGTKEVLNRGIEGPIRASNEYVQTWNAGFLPTKDLLEAITATMEKRPPEYTGR